MFRVAGKLKVWNWFGSLAIYLQLVYGMDVVFDIWVKVRQLADQTDSKYVLRIS